MRFVNYGEMWNFSLLFLSILLVNSDIIKDREVSFPCFPEKLGNFSSEGAAAVVYGIVDETKPSGAAIFCSISGKIDQYVKLELTLYGEPPNNLTVQVHPDVLSQFDKSVINCCSKDILEKNRLGEDMEEFQLNMTGIVTYVCVGHPHLHIDLAGLEMIKKDFGGHCVIVGKTGDSDRLGKPCDCPSGGCVEMYSKLGSMVCAKCCPGSYWELDKTDPENNKGACKECGPDYKTTERNVITDCPEEHSSQKKTDSETLKPTMKTTSTQSQTIKPITEPQTYATDEKMEPTSTVSPPTPDPMTKSTAPPKTKKTDDTTTTATNTAQPGGPGEKTDSAVLWGICFPPVVLSLLVGILIGCTFSEKIRARFSTIRSFFRRRNGVAQQNAAPLLQH